MDQQKLIDIPVGPKIPGFNSSKKKPNKNIPSFNKLHLVIENEELENSPMRNLGSQNELGSFAMRAAQLL